MAFTFVTLSSNAQIAYEKAKPLDNMYFGIQGGISSPLDFNSVTPFNAISGIKIGKWISPTFGLEAEGNAWFGDNHFAESKTVVKASYVGLNGQINLTALTLGYNPSKTFEVSTSTGLGWIHMYNAPGELNYLGAKTGLSFAWNLGYNKAWQINVNPAVYWNLSETGKIQFNKNHSQLALLVGITYKFKTSNGTHGFRDYNIGRMLEEIDRMREELEKKPKEVFVDRPVPTTVKTDVVESKWFVFFAQNSDVLTSEAIDVLELVPQNTTVSIVGSASIEGTAEYNQDLSERRAAAVSDYLAKKGINVVSATGVGAQSETSGRIAVIEVVNNQ